MQVGRVHKTLSFHRKEVWQNVERRKLISVCGKKEGQRSDVFNSHTYFAILYIVFNSFLYLICTSVHSISDDVI